jgi:phosphoribosyl 1,2-cyclic phosphate phosphodiesterase
MEVTLLGTGDSSGTPTVGCDCATCRRAIETGVERSRFSVHVRNDATGESLLVDASPDFRQQFLTNDVSLPDAAVITHVHFDHLDGLGNVYRLLDHLPVYAADETDPVTGESVAGTVECRYEYLDGVAVGPATPHESFRAAGFDVTLVPVDHPPLLCYGLRIEEPASGTSLSITGDTSFAVPERSVDALAGADLALVEGIVHAEFCDGHPAGGAHPDDDGVYRTFGTKHMTLTGARETANRLDPDAYRLVHVSHYVPPERAFAADMAVDGDRFHV